MNVTTEERDKLLDELTDEYSVKEIEPDEITVRMLAEKLHVSERTALVILNRKVADGLLTSHYVRDTITGRRVKAFKKNG